LERRSSVELQGDAAHVGGGEPLMVPVQLEVVAAEGALLGRLHVRGGAAERAQECAALADCIDEQVPHTWGCVRVSCRLNVRKRGPAQRESPSRTSCAGPHASRSWRT